MTCTHAFLGRVVPLAVLSAAALAAGDARAQSCGMGDIDWYGTERNEVSRAQELLVDGEPRKTADVLQHMWPHLREAVPVKDSLPVILDGVRLMAIATARTDGNVPSQLGWSSWTPGERAQNVAWGVSRLRMLVAADPEDTSLETDLAEALSRNPATRPEARAILEALDAEDRIASPQGFSALSVSLGAAGETIAAAIAHVRCEKRATNATVECAASRAYAEPEETASR